MYEEFIKEYKIFEKTKSDKNSEIIKSIIKTQKEIENANINYEFAEEDLVDYYAYQIKANQAKLNYLIKNAKKNGIILSRIKQIEIGLSEENNKVV